MKKKISAEIIADSKNGAGDRITTFVLTFPRIILAELNTHRVFSRNSASSRAIPFKRMLEMVKEDPFIPIAFQKDHSGMQGKKYHSKNKLYNLDSFTSSLIDTLQTLDRNSGEYVVLSKEIGLKIDMIKEILSPYRYDEKTLNEWWLFARDKAIESACIMYIFRVTKQLCNRILEPFMWHTAIVTATEFENFFKQRCPQYDIPGVGEFRSRKDVLKYMGENGDPESYEYWDSYNELQWLKVNKGQGEIHIMELAEQMWDAMNENIPNELLPGEWHIPFGDKFDDLKILTIVDNYNTADRDRGEGTQEKLIREAKVKIATARCARISYLNFDGTDDYEKDIKLHDRLASMFHWSPFEHCAKAMSTYEKSPMVLKVKTDNISETDKAQLKQDWEQLNKETGVLLLNEDIEPEILHVSDKSRNFTGFIQYRGIIEK